jgi:16S rRNA (uracil1498-N3)-methyltransferase
MSRRKFFVDEVQNGRARIAGPEAGHLTRVLRVEAGQKFEISDNRKVYLAQVESARKDLVTFAIVGEIEARPPVLRASLLLSLIRFERFELAIEKATELGVERVIPVEAERAAAGLEKAARKRLERWRRIAREASEQSRRDHLPEIEEPRTFDAALAIAADYRYVPDEAEARPFAAAMPPAKRASDRVAVLVGPEGGWTDRERLSIAAAGWTPVSLGPQILRAETAAIAALAILNAAWTAG